MAITEEQVVALKTKYPGVKLVELKHPNGTSVVVRKPGTHDYRKWADRKADVDSRGTANQLLFQDCVVHPAGDELLRLIEDLPALPDTFSQDLLELAGAAVKTEKKEL